MNLTKVKIDNGLGDSLYYSQGIAEKINFTRVKIESDLVISFVLHPRIRTKNETDVG